MFKRLSILLFWSAGLFGDAVVTENYIYSFSQAGEPKSRVNIETGAISMASSDGFLDIRFAKHISLFDVYKKNKKFMSISKEEKIKIATNYFNKEVRHTISDIDTQEQDRYLKIFIKKILEI